MNTNHKANANVQLIRYVTRRIDEFLDEQQGREFGSMAEMQNEFSRFLRLKEKGDITKMKILKEGPGMIAQQIEPEDVWDQHSFTLAFLKLFPNGHAGVMWFPQLFSVPGGLPDELRRRLVSVLRFHADKLEDHTLDRRMQECAPKFTADVALDNRHPHSK